MSDLFGYVVTVSKDKTFLEKWMYDFIPGKEVVIQEVLDRGHDRDDHVIVSKVVSKETFEAVREGKDREQIVNFLIG